MRILSGPCRIAALSSLLACGPSPGETSSSDETGAGPSTSSAEPTSGTSSTGSTGSTGSTADEPTEPGTASTGGTTIPEPGTTTEPGTSTGDTSTGDTSTSSGTGSTGSTGGPDTTTGEFTPVGCDPMWPMTGPVQGQTPVGDLVFEFAAFDPDFCGSSGSIDLLMFSAMPLIDTNGDVVTDSMWLHVDLQGDWNADWISVGPVHATIFDDQWMPLAEGEGSLEITALDIMDDIYLFDGGAPHSLAGHLQIDAPGWALAGDFNAAICWAVAGHTLCP